MIKHTIHNSILIAIWVTGCVLSFSLIAFYEFSPGQNNLNHSIRSDSWRATSTRDIIQDGYRLKIFVHPHCPCSVASLHEFERLVRDVGLPAENVTVVIASYSDSVDEKQSGSIVNLAHQLFSTEQITYLPSTEIETHFGSLISGTTLLFSPHDELCFSGGITPRRGHQGESPGRQSIISMIHQQEVATTESPAFGCSISTLSY